MKRKFRGSVLAGSLAIAMVAGCGEDPNQRIALLEQDNQRLLDELGQARSAADECRNNLQACDQELSMARADLGRMNSELVALRNRPAPEPVQAAPEGWVNVPGGAMIAVPGEVLFKSGKAELRNDAQRTLDQIVRTLQSEYPTQDVLVYGHTDDVPIKKSGWDDNFELSAQRALSVVRYFESHGIAPSRLVAGGCGEHRPMAPNQSAESRARNRRVEVFALDVPIRNASR